MWKIRKETGLAVIVLGAGGLLAAIVGLFAYVSFTAIPLHPDPQKVPSVTRSTPAPKWNGAVEQGRQLVRAAIAEQNLPGVSVAVGVGGDIVWAEGFGFADLETRVPVAPEMRFRIAEVSIPLTSAAVGLLLENGTLKLDDEIQTYVPEFPKKEWPVTLRQLMGHLAGVRGDAGDEEPLEERCARTVDALPRFAKSSLRFEPGTRYSPSSYGWVLVSAAVEAAARERFFSVMRAQVFEPLGMRDTRPDLTFSETIPDLVTFYFPRFGGDTRYGPEAVRDGDHSCAAGAGGFLSTPSDVVRFGMAISSRLRQGSGAQGRVRQGSGEKDGTLLQPATVTLLQTPQRLPSGEETGYGLGWQIETVQLAGEPARMAGHGTKDDFIGGSAYLMTFPERGIVVAVTTNISFADLKSMALKIADAFAGQ